MPKKSRVRANGTQAGQQSKTEIYKSIASYKTLNIKDDLLNQNLKDLYENNIWNLKLKFESLKITFRAFASNDNIPSFATLNKNGFIEA
jgi:hypothetical protein